MCDSCCNTTHDLDSFFYGEGCYYDEKHGCWYFVITRFNEINRAPVNFCPECGRDLRISK